MGSQPLEELAVSPASRLALHWGSRLRVRGLELWDPRRRFSDPKLLAPGLCLNSKSQTQNAGASLEELPSTPCGASWWQLPQEEKVNTLGLQPSSLLNVHPWRPKPSEMLEPHSNVGVILGQGDSDVDES